VGEAKQRDKIRGYLINRAHFASLIGARDPFAMSVCLEIVNFLSRPPAKPGEGALCGACNHEFVGEKKPDAFYILRSDDGQVSMTGFCSHCAHLPIDELLMAMEPFLRENSSWQGINPYGLGRAAPGDDSGTRKKSWCRTLIGRGQTGLIE
jgi:hypothetical protein